MPHTWDSYCVAAVSCQDGSGAFNLSTIGSTLLVDMANMTNVANTVKLRDQALGGEYKRFPPPPPPPPPRRPRRPPPLPPPPPPHVCRARRRYTGVTSPGRLPGALNPPEDGSESLLTSVFATDEHVAVIVPGGPRARAGRYESLRRPSVPCPLRRVR